jgi:hypothetical protein
LVDESSDILPIFSVNVKFTTRTIRVFLPYIHIRDEENKDSEEQKMVGDMAKVHDLLSPELEFENDDANVNGCG